MFNRKAKEIKRLTERLSYEEFMSGCKDQRILNAEKRGRDMNARIIKANKELVEALNDQTEKLINLTGENKRLTELNDAKNLQISVLKRRHKEIDLRTFAVMHSNNKQTPKEVYKFITKEASDEVSD